MPRQTDPAPEPEVDEEGTQAEEETAAPPQTDPEAPEEAAVDEEPEDDGPLLVIEDVDEPEAAEEAPDVEPVPEEPASPPVPAGLLRDPVAVDASADGVVWILDASRRALIGMRREPGDAGAVPLVGLPDGQPVDFAFAPGGQSFYVLTHAPAAVWRLDTSGRRNGKTLPVPFRGVSEHSQRLAVDALGQVFVVGRYQGHVLRYSADGAFRGSYGGARVKETLDLATGADGRTWVLDAEAPFLLCFDRDGWLLGRRLAPGPRQSDISMPVRIAAGLSWREPDRETPLRLFGLEFRGVRVYAMNADGVLRRPKFFGGAERTGGPFRKPVDMAVADRCRFGVLDQALNKITLYWAAEPEGFRQWDRHLPDAAEGERIKPQLLTFDPLNGDAYVYDAVARTIARYDAITTRDTAVNKTGHIGGRGEAPGRFMDVVGMAVDAAGVLWVLDAERRDLQWFDARQDGLSHMGAYPLTEIRGDLTGVAVTPTGLVLVLSGEGELYAYRPVLP
jgi:sugar lactone lactonase YvrE